MEQKGCPAKEPYSPIRPHWESVGQNLPELVVCTCEPATLRPDQATWPPFTCFLLCGWGINSVGLMAGMMNGSGQAGHVPFAVAFKGLLVPRELIKI